MRTIALLLTMGAVCAGAAFSQEAITYTDLAEALTDLESLATLPPSGETCTQWSSWERLSRFDEATGKYVAWDANGDGDGFIREEDGAIVMAEMTGPGCIRRTWSALPEAGHVRVYLDGATEPAIDLPFSDYFNRKAAPFDRPSLCYESAKGWNNYTPIPYRKSCKIVADKGWGRYYHFTYTTFPKGTVVDTFKMDLEPEESAALDAADKFLSNMGSDPAGTRDGEVKDECEVLAAPGATAGVASIEGPRAVTTIRARLALPEPPGDRAVLRELCLKITWDGEAEPAVWTPLGDFFGTAPGANRYSSLPAGLTEDGWWYAHWYMPFAESAAVELVNDGAVERAVTFEITHAPLASPVEKLGRFHAKWHRDALLPEEPERAIDWTMLKTQGRGRFCGVMLHVWNPRGGWWGEGDEKFHVDGEKFPSTFGTGTEDYFGSAWCNPGLFTRAYHNQTISMGNAGHISVNRWHVNDNIPFQTSFEGYIEKYFPNPRPTLYDCTAYWYLAPGGRDPYGPVPVAERMEWPEAVVRRVNGAIEGEKMKVAAKTGGTTQMQNLAGHGDGWSGEAHLWWTQGKPGDKLDLVFQVEDAGAVRLLAQLTKAVDYAIVQLYLDNGKLGAPIDLYNRGVVPTGELDLGTHKLAAGEHTLTLEITGANPLAKKAYMAGVDYVRLEKLAE